MLAEEKAVFEGVVGVDQELAAAGDVGRARYLGDNGLIRAELRGRHNPAGEAGTQDAFNHKGLVDFDFTLSVEES